MTSCGGLFSAATTTPRKLPANTTVSPGWIMRSLKVLRGTISRLTSSARRWSASPSDSIRSLALVWGSEDFVSLVKEISGLDKGDEFEAFEARGGVMDGQRLTADDVGERDRTGAEGRL